MPGQTPPRGLRRGVAATSGGKQLAVYGMPAFAYMYTVGSVGFWLSLYAKELGFSYTTIQLLATVYFAFITPATILSGILADKTGKPGLIAGAGMLLNGAATLAMAHLTEPGPLLATRALQGLGLANAFPIALGALSLAVGVRGGVGSTAMIMGVGMAVGSVAGGVLLELYGFKALFYSAALVSIAAGVVALRSRYPSPGPRPRLLEALRRVPRSVWAVLAGLLARNIMATGVYSVLAVIFNQVMGLSLLETAVALSLNPIVQAVSSRRIALWASGREVLVYSLGIVGTGIVFLIYLLSGTLLPVLAAQVIQGLSFAAINVAGNMYIIERSPDEIRYTASSLFGFFFNLGWILGTLAAGPVMDAYSPRAWLALASMVIPVVGVATFLAARRLE